MNWNEWNDLAGWVFVLFCFIENQFLKKKKKIEYNKHILDYKKDTYYQTELKPNKYSCNQVRCKLLFGNFMVYLFVSLYFFCSNIKTATRQKGYKNM